MHGRRLESANFARSMRDVREYAATVTNGGRRESVGLSPARGDDMASFLDALNGLAEAEAPPWSLSAQSDVFVVGPANDWLPPPRVRGRWRPATAPSVPRNEWVNDIVNGRRRRRRTRKRKGP